MNHTKPSTDLDLIGSGISTTIRLSNGAVALVDLDDLPALSKYRWYRMIDHNGAPRARANIGGGVIDMGRFILGLQKGDKKTVDHISGDTLDNRRANLRVATYRQNAHNATGKRRNNRGRHPSSRFKGVHFADGQWRVQIRVDGRVKDVGWFKDEREAALAYDAAARKHHGPFARVNFQEAA